MKLEDCQKQEEKKKSYFIELVKELKKNKKSYDLMKLNKLLYFSYAKGEGSSFDALEFEAWENGPVIASERNIIVYRFFASIENYINFYEERKNYELTDEEKKIIEEIVKLFGDFKSYKLSNLTHNDVFNHAYGKEKTPWKEANPNEESCNKKIDLEKIRDFYSSKWFEDVEKNKEKIMEMLG